MDDPEKNRQEASDATPEPMQPEEVAPDIEHPEEIAGSIPPEFPTDVPVYEENSSKLPMIMGIVLFFIIVFGLIFWFFLKDRLFPPDNTPKPSAGEVTLTYWGLWDDPAVYRPLIEAYQKENPNIKINYERMDPDQYRERLIAHSQAGNGPDMFRYHNTWLPEIQEVISPLSEDIMSNQEFEQTFYPIHQKDLKIADKYYGIPLMVDGAVLIYNETLLKQAGISTPPPVWVGGDNDVLNTVNKLTVKEPSGQIVTSGIAIGTANNIPHYGEIFGILLLLNGGDLKDLTTNEASEALLLYRKFAEDGYWNASMPNAVSAFTQGKVAMIIAPSWHVINIKAQNPDLQVKVAPIPKGLDESAVSVASYWVEGVNRLSQNQTEAWKFLKFLAEREQLTKMYETQTQVRLFGNPYPRQDMADMLRDNQYLAPVIRQAQDDVYVGLPLADLTHDEGMNDEVLQYIKNAINSAEEGVDYTAALSTADQGIKQVLERYALE